MFAFLHLTRMAAAVLIAGAPAPAPPPDTVSVLDSSTLTLPIAKQVIEVGRKLDALQKTDSPMVCYPDGGANESR